jgi:hypothetical protein
VGRASWPVLFYSYTLASFHKQSEANEQGFPHLPFQMETINEVRAYAGSVRSSRDTVCLIGIGGSPLGAWALDCGIWGPHPEPDILAMLLLFCTKRRALIRGLRILRRPPGSMLVQSKRGLKP